MSGPLARAAAGALLLAVGSSCAARRSPGVTCDNTDYGYPILPADCIAGLNQPSALHVELRDETGQPVPGVLVWVVAADGPVDGYAPPGVRTDKAGSATFRLGAGRYVVLAPLGGFFPEARGVYLGPGCTGRIALTLRIADRPPAASTRR